MVIYREFKELKSLAAPVHWAVGMFDGVHLGHAGVEGAVRHGPVVICRSTQQTAGTVEAAVPWVGSPNFSKMPFPGKIGTVSRFFQKFRQGGDTRVQASAVAGAPAVVIQEPYVHLVRFAAGHDGGPGG